MRFSNIVETICRSETSETEDTSSDNHSMASEDDDLRARRAGSDKEQGYNTVVALKRVATESKRVEVLLLHLVLELAWKEGQLMMELILVGGSSVMTVTVSLDTHSGILQRLEVAQAKEDVVAMQMLKRRNSMHN